MKAFVQSLLETLVTKYQSEPVVANLAIAGVIGSILGYVGLTADTGTVIVVVGFVVPVLIGAVHARSKVTPVD